MDKKRKKKGLKLKAEYLKLELEEKDEEIRHFEKDFIENLMKLELEDIEDPAKTNDPKPDVRVEILDGEAKDQDEVSEQTPEEAKDENYEEFKKLWKQIAILTHPDKSGNDPVKLEQYKKAAVAWDEKNYAEIISIAEELGINMPEETLLDLHILEKFINDLEGKIKENEDSILRAWAKATPEKREKILDVYLKSKGKKRKPANSN